MLRALAPSHLGPKFGTGARACARARTRASTHAVCERKLHALRRRRTPAARRRAAGGGPAARDLGPAPRRGGRSRSDAGRGLRIGPSPDRWPCGSWARPSGHPAAARKVYYSIELRISVLNRTHAHTHVGPHPRTRAPASRRSPRPDSGGGTGPPSRSKLAPPPAVSGIDGLGPRPPSPTRETAVLPPPRDIYGPREAMEVP